MKIKDNMIERIVFALFILLAIVVGGVIWLIPSKGHAAPVTEATWQAGSFTVERRHGTETVGQWCTFLHATSLGAYGMYRLYDGTYKMNILLMAGREVRTWTTNQYVELDIDSKPFHVNGAVPNNTGQGLSFIPDQAFRDAYYIGKMMTIRVGGFQATFDLRGTAAAMRVMNDQCAPSMGVQPSPTYRTYATPEDCIKDPVCARTPAGQPYTPSRPSTRGETTLVRIGNGKHFAATITINGIATMTALLDSGATDISIGPTVARRLAASGTVTSADYAGTVEYTLADGRTQRQKTYYLRSVVIGGYTINNVRASFTDSDDNELIGVGLLAKFKQWAIDNQRNVLILTP